MGPAIQLPARGFELAHRLELHLGGRSLGRSTAATLNGVIAADIDWTGQP